MKLIIDIPEEDYMYITKYQNVSGCGNMLTNSIINGTPFDYVIEEERKKYNDIALDLLGEVEFYEKAIEDIKAEIADGQVKKVLDEVLKGEADGK